ncbi:MAG TPA: hypothetical protein VGG64_28945 [Pirellulales bacterium]|jgi:hypothetical protein
MSATFWWVLTIICLVWYSTVTVYVGIRGAWDIKNMLSRLEHLQNAEDEGESQP